MICNNSSVQQLPVMIQKAQTEELIQIISDFSVKMPTNDELNKFAAQWLAHAENESKKIEQEYIWKLIRGQLNQQGIHYKMQNQQQLEWLEETNDWKAIWEQNNPKKNIFASISKNEAVLKVQEAVFLINPTKKNFNFLNQLQTAKYQLYIVITNANLKNISALVHLIQRTKCQRVITTEQIYAKMLIFQDFLKKSKLKEVEDVLKTKIGLLREDQYFQYGRVLWKVKGCCWYQPVYDLQISIKDTKPLLIEGPKIYQSKSIYYGWKKNYITEDNYQKYTAQTQLLNRERQKMITFELGQEDIAVKKGKKYLNFIQKELIRELQDEEKQDIWLCCEELQFAKGQTIIKKGTQCDYVYALQNGEFLMAKDSQVQTEADKSLLYGLLQLKRGDKKYSFDLKSKLYSSVQRIRVQNVKFHLYDYLIEHK